MALSGKFSVCCVKSEVKWPSVGKFSVCCVKSEVKWPSLASSLFVVLRVRSSGPKWQVLCLLSQQD